MESCPLPPGGGSDASRTASFNWQRAATLTLVAACALYFLWRVHDVLPPFLIAFFLASLLDPIVSRLQRRGVSRARAVATIYLLVFLLIVLAVMVVVPPTLNQMSGFANKAGDYGTQLTGITDSWFNRNKAVLSRLGVKSNPLSTNPQSGALGDAARQILTTLKGAIQDFAGRILWLIIIPLSLFYFLLDYRALRAKLISFAPGHKQSDVERMAEEIVEIFGDYFRSLATVCVFYGLTAAAIFYALGLNYALFLGIAAGVLYAVPYVGPAVAICTSAVVAMTVERPAILLFMQPHISPVAYAVLVVVCFVAMHLSFDYGVTPRVVGGSVGLHPLVNIFALMCGATLFGIWGMLLAVPVAASIQMLLLYFFPKLGEKAPAQATDVVASVAVQHAIDDEAQRRSDEDEAPDLTIIHSPERLNA